MFMMLVMLATLIIPADTAAVVHAEEDTKPVPVFLGTGGIKAPSKGEADKPWRGSYLWFGKYNEFYTKYRVLAPYTERFGSGTMFLDCDSLLYTAAFDDLMENYNPSEPESWHQNM